MIHISEVILSHPLTNLLKSKIRAIMQIRGETGASDKSLIVQRPLTPTKADLKEFLLNIIKNPMTAKLIYAKEREFNDKEKNQLIRGWTLIFLDEQTGNTNRYFVSNDDLKGFDPKQLCKITGKNLEISTTAKTFQGITKIKLEKIIELV
jgi:hypothetical protein